MHTKRMWGVALAAAGLAVTAATAAPASAAQSAARPTASFSFTHSRVNQKTKAQFTYSTSRLPKGSAIYLQWQVGTKKVWKNVLHLRRASGTDNAPGARMGKWMYRIRVVRDGSTVVSSKSHPLYDYGTVPYQQLCDAWVGDCIPFDIQIGNTVFTVMFGVNNAQYPTGWGTVLQFHKTSCRSVTMQYATQTVPDNVYIQLIQADSPAQSGEGPGNQVNTFTASMDGGPFILEVADDNGGDWIDVNGSADCYTSDGELS